ncbi:MAG: thiamine pyrophosphate-dependent dehydrogenase E1 component subunit alpha [Chloroflexi bacterium]|nr:thiamine pyrophosphate-dependent dehydrogenase E1 component subunit alpha [Chloroflexota bacterium]MDA1218384.1 thiamine pyrophosphate-dependent dehydrogenase E1 component subunit alpha [Chloroflexota bacterium]
MPLDHQQLLEMYRKMVTIRTFTRRAFDESIAGNIPVPVPANVGEEGSAVGVCAALRQDDRITSTHRSLGHAIAKGVDIKLIMAELYGRSNGCCGGKGGTMHIADFSVGMLGANGIVGGGLPIATGAALAAQMDGGDSVAVAFFGDGASNEGTFHSTLNLAAIWKLPMVFVCENNGWAIGVPASYALSVEDVSVRAVSYGIPGLTVDGTDVLAVYEVMNQAVARARSGDGPTLIECKNYRWDSNSSTREEDARGGLRDPVLSLRERLLAEGIADAAAIGNIERGVESAVTEAVAFAASGPVPGLEDALADVFAA